MVILEIVVREGDLPPDFSTRWPLRKYRRSACYTIFRASCKEMSAQENADLVSAVKRGQILDFSSYRPVRITRKQRS